MVKIKNIVKRLLTCLLISGTLFAQDITFEPHDTFIYDTLGTEIIFTIDVTNISQSDQTIFLVRTINDLPVDWTSSLCFDLCFASFVDSIATTPLFGSTALTSGETREVSLHVFTMIGHGTANVQLQVGTFDNQDDRITSDFTATTLLTSVENDLNQPVEYYLAQNYPNPFNPTTNTSYGIKEAGSVSLKIYNILGNEVATLVDEYKPAANYDIKFENSHLSSGIYIYRLVTNNYSESHKMVLEK